jgi:hypothetical protein
MNRFVSCYMCVKLTENLDIVTCMSDYRRSLDWQSDLMEHIFSLYDFTAL